MVFEGAVAFLDPKDSRQFGKLMDRRRYDEAVELFELNETMAKVLSDRVWRDARRIDIVTYIGPDNWAEAVSDWLRAAGIPFSSCWATTPQILGRQITYRHDIHRVYDPWEQNKFIYGPKGHWLTDPNQVGRA